MATRREQRKNIALSVRVFGTDAAGRIFSETVTTVNVSLEGAMVAGLKPPVKPGEIIGLRYGNNKARFQVQWVGQPGTPLEGTVGLRNLLPTTPFWDVKLPARGLDDKGRIYASQRRFPRVKCSTSVELRQEGAPPVWTKAGDMNLGGCFVEMMIPLRQGTRMKIMLWLKDDKIVAEGVVANARPGYGVGVRFTEMSAEDSGRLKEFLSSMVRIPIPSFSQAGKT